MPVVRRQHLIGLEHMRVRADHDVHAALQKHLRPLALERVRLLRVLRPPVGKHDHKIRLGLRLRDVRLRRRKQMHHIGILLRNADPVRAISIVEQRETDAVDPNHRVRLIFRLVRCLDPKTRYLVVVEKALCEIYALRTSVERMVRRTGNDVKPRIHDRLPHGSRRAKPRIIADHQGIVCQRCLLIDDGGIALVNLILHILEHIVKRPLALQTIPVDRLVRQDISKRDKRDRCIFFRKAPRIPFPAAHLVVRGSKPQTYIGRFLSVRRDVRSVLPEMGGHPFGTDPPVVVFIHKKMLRPCVLVLLDPEWPVLPVASLFPAQEHQLVRAVVVDIAGEYFLNPHLLRGSPYDTRVSFCALIFYAAAHPDCFVTQLDFVSSRRICKDTVLPYHPVRYLRAKVQPPHGRHQNDGADCCQRHEDPSPVPLFIPTHICTDSSPSIPVSAPACHCCGFRLRPTGSPSSAATSCRSVCRSTATGTDKTSRHFLLPP